MGAAAQKRGDDRGMRRRRSLPRQVFEGHPGDARGPVHRGQALRRREADAPLQPGARERRSRPEPRWPPHVLRARSGASASTRSPRTRCAYRRSCS